ncbi:MAG: hypothetical protein DRN66_01420 [Candidatus Nanohalarchaeota archaeon]|nr:MAG: hypothetical protein DRN66_01420 [Candidatus Nanohaloarchaeota archaeon]
MIDSDDLLKDTNQNWLIIVAVVVIIITLSYKIFRDYSLFDFSIFLIILPVMLALFFLMLFFYKYMEEYKK